MFILQTGCQRSSADRRQTIPQQTMDLVWRLTNKKSSKSNCQQKGIQSTQSANIWTGLCFSCTKNPNNLTDWIWQNDRSSISMRVVIFDKIVFSAKKTNNDRRYFKKSQLVCLVGPVTPDHTMIKLEFFIFKLQLWLNKKKKKTEIKKETKIISI